MGHRREDCAQPDTLTHRLQSTCAQRSEAAVITVSSPNEASTSSLPTFILVLLHFLKLSYFPSSHSHSDSCITLQLLFGCQIFYTFTVTLIQFRTKSQNAQPCRLPFSVTPLAINIYPEFSGILYVFYLAQDKVCFKSF